MSPSPPPPPQRRPDIGERLRRLARASTLVRLAGRALPGPLVALCFAGQEGGVSALLTLPLLFVGLLPALWELDAERDPGRSWRGFLIGLIAATFAGALLALGQAAYLGHWVESLGLSPWSAKARLPTSLLAALNVAVWTLLLAGPIALGATLRQLDALELTPRYAIGGALLLSLLSAPLLALQTQLGPCELLTLAACYLLASMVLATPAFLCDRCVEWAGP